MTREVVYMDLDEVIEAAVNPKGHDDDEIKASIERFGIVELPTWDERTGTLIAGHGRTKAVRDARAAVEAGEPMNEWLTSLMADDSLQLPDGAEGVWKLAVIRGWASTDDAEHRAAIVALNRVGERGGWEPGIIDVLQELDDLTGTGFTTSEMDDLLASFDDELVLPEQETDAAHADLPPPRKAPPPPPREQQGLRDVVLVMQLPLHQEYSELLATLKRLYGEQVAAMVVVRAMREAAAAEVQ